MTKDDVVKKFVEKQYEDHLLKARMGEFFRESIDNYDLAPWKALEYEALDALEKRIEALELRGGS